MEMSPSPKAKTLIEKWEGLSLTAYRDQRGIWTIGYGQTGPQVHEGQIITQAEAEVYLNTGMRYAANAVNNCVKTDITQNQFDALCALVYNIGPTAFMHSSLLGYINTRNWKAAGIEWLKWDHGVGGRMSVGLLNRRRDELELFIS